MRRGQLCFERRQRERARARARARERERERDVRIGYISIFLWHRNLTNKIFSIRLTFHKKKLSFFSSFFVNLVFLSTVWQCFCLRCLITNNSFLFRFAHSHTLLAFAAFPYYLVVFLIFYSLQIFLGFNRCDSLLTVRRRVSSVRNASCDWRRRRRLLPTRLRALLKTRSAGRSLRLAERDGA